MSSDLPIPSTPYWMRLVFFSLILLFPVMDMAISYLYHLTGSPQVIMLRYYRDASCLLLAAFGFFDRNLPYQLRLATGIYGMLLLFYALLSLLLNVAPPFVILASLGTLIIPFSLSFAAFAAIRTANDLRRLTLLLIIYATASALFGLWEIDHTEFWTDTIAIGPYIWDVKGIPTGFQPDVFLPWNFHGLNHTRRAAGLLAAPLAQGFFLAIVSLIAFAFLRARSLLLASLIAGLCFYGVNASATRGALLTLAIAAGFYFLYPAQDAKTRKTNLILVTVFAVISFQILAHHVLYTVRLEDNSTIGHVHAIEKNLRDIGAVAIVGSGIGAAGGQASSVGLEIEGGGEGAFFSIAYQLGLPGAAIFLWFLSQLFRQVFAHRDDAGTSGELARALAFLFFGVALSMFTSEHILTFSGMGAFWFFIGSYLGYMCRKN